jgi:O-antigen/teichoic acid export membrane protein
MDAQPEPGDVRTNEDLTHVAGQGLRWVTYARIVGEIVTLASMVVLARLIPPAAFGVFAVVVIAQELARIVPSEGVGSALVQRRGIVRSHLEGGVLMSLGMGAALAAVVLVLAHFLVRPVFGDETADLMIVASPCFFLSALGTVPTAVLRRRLDFARLSVIDVANTLSRTAATVALAVAGLDAPALVFGYLAGLAVGVVLACAFARPPLPRWRRREMGELLPYGGPATLASLAWTGFRNGDYAIIGATLGPAQAGLYWRAYQLSVEYQKKISSVMSHMAFPVLARTAGREEMLALRHRMVQSLTVILFPALTLLVILAPEMIPWLFGERWEPAVLPAQILAAGGAATLVIDAVGPALMAQGRAKALLGYGVAHFVAYAGAVLVVAKHGIAAVAVAASVVHGVFVLFAYLLLLRDGIVRAVRSMAADTGAATVGCAALVAVAAPAEWALDRAQTPVVLHLAAVSAVAAIAYLLVLRLAFPAAAADLAAIVRRVLPRAGLRRLLGRRRALQARAQRRRVPA